MDSLINLKICLKSVTDIDEAVSNLVNILQSAAKTATPSADGKLVRSAIKYPLEVWELVAEKRRARHLWHQSRNPSDKTVFNNLCKKLHNKIQEINNNSFQSYLQSLSPTATTNYSLWKATKKIKKPTTQIPPLCSSNGGWARSDEEKDILFASHLEQIFQPHQIESDLNLNTFNEYCDSNSSISLVKPIEIAREIAYNLKLNKAPGFDSSSAQMLKELSRTGMVLCYSPTLSTLFLDCNISHMHEKKQK